MQETGENLVIVRPEERAYGAMVHLFGAIPIWGFVTSLAVWHYYKNRSREMVFHVQQAISFHIVILLILLLGIMMQLLANILALLNSGLADTIEALLWWFCISLYSLCAACALWGAVMVYSGRPFLYPVIGSRVLRGARHKFSEE